MLSKFLKTAFFLVAVSTISANLFAMGGQEIPNNGKKNVAVSFDAMKELTQAVAKDKVNISVIIPEGMEPHGFEPRAKDIAFLSTADILIYNGFGMEFWLEEALDAIKNGKLVKIEASEGITPIKATHHHDAEHHEHSDEHHHDAEHHEHNDEHHHDAEHHEHNDEHHHDAEHHHHHHGEFDPHTWLGLSSAKVMVNNIAKALSKVDSENANFYKENAKKYSEEIDKLLTEYQAKFKNIDNKNFVAGHAAFAYLCRDFGLEQSSVMGVFAEGEPNAKELAELVEHCKEHKITTIFSEKSASAAVSKALAKEVNAKVEKIYTIEMPEDGKSYLERMQHNLERIYTNLKNNK